MLKRLHYKMNSCANGANWNSKREVWNTYYSNWVERKVWNAYYLNWEEFHLHVCSEVSGEMAHGSLWSNEEVKALIAIRGEEGVQNQLDGTTRNIKVYGKISHCLCELAFKRTAVQCREKLKKLKSDYRCAKDRNSTSGRGRTICAYFTQLDVTMWCRPASPPNGVVGSMS